MINDNNYTFAEINNALLASNRSIKFRFDLINRYGISQGNLDGITSAKVQYGNLRSIKGTATFTIARQTKEIDFLNDSIQPWFILNMPNGGTVEWSQGIYRLPIVPDSIEGLHISKEVAGFDRTMRLKRWAFPNRYFIPQGTEYSATMVQILTMAGITSFDIPFSGQRFSANREIDIGRTALETLNEFCTEINYNSIRADKDGVIRTEPYIFPDLRNVTQRYIANEKSIILPSINSGLDITEVANIFICISENIDSGERLIGRYVNDNFVSRISTVNQDEIVAVYTFDNISSQEVIDAKAKRVAIENSSKYSHVNFSTALMPDHNDQDVVYLDLTNPKFKAEILRRGEIIPDIFKSPQKLFETAWEMELKPGGHMSHETRKVVNL